MLNITLTEGGWLEGLSAVQSDTIEQLIASGKSEEEVGELWLSITGSNNTLGFGVGGQIQNFYKNVKAEFVSFICGDEKYNEEREKAIQIWNTHGKMGLVSMVAAVVAANIGLAFAAVVPVIALLFSLASKIGLNAFCATCKAE